MSHESLPKYASPTLERERELGGATTLPPRRLFLGLVGRASPPTYEALPSDDPEDELKKGLLADDASTAPPSPTTPAPATPDSAPPAYPPGLPVPPAYLPRTSAPASAPAVTSIASPTPAPTTTQKARTVLYNVLWYPRLLAFLALVGAPVALFCGFVGWMLATFFGLGWAGATARLAQEFSLLAVVVGAPVVGAGVGGAVWALVCVARVVNVFCPLPPKEELPRPATAAGTRTLTMDEARERALEAGYLGAQGPTHPVWYVVPGAAVLSVFGMAVGVAVVPSVRAAAAEAGWNAGIAVGYGVWGGVLPFVPVLVWKMFVILGAP